MVDAATMVELQALSREELIQLEAETRADSLACEEKFELYQPNNEVVEKFHASKARVRALVAGNRSGKTVALLMEAIIQATGRIPKAIKKDYFKGRLRPVSVGRICATDYENGVEKVIKPALLQWVPRGVLIPGSEVTNRGTQVNFVGGSVIEMMSYAQPPIKFGGTPRDFIGYDEPPPPDIVKENEMRTIDHGGHEVYSFTPVVHARDEVSGQTTSNARAIAYFYDHIYRRASRIVRPDSDVINPKGDPWIEVFHMSSFMNPNIDAEILNQILEGLTESEKKARVHGEFQHLIGLVYGQHFSQEQHVIDHEKFEYDPTWPVYCAIDTHPAKPHKITYMWVDPHNRMVVCDELSIYGTVDELADVMFKLEKERDFWVIWRLIDPMANAPDMETKISFRVELGKRGIVCRPGSKEPLTGIYATRAAFASNHLFFTDNCEGHLWEIMQYIWKGDKPLKENDDYMENLRRLVLANPLSITREEVRRDMDSEGELNY